MATQQPPDHDNEITPVVYSHAPGTELLFESGKPGTHHTLNLQTVQDRDGNHIILVPQPSLTDPNDPLRWSRTRKWATLLNGIGYAFMGSVTGPIMAAMMIPLTERFGVSLQKLTYANGATLICQGVGNVFWMPLAIKLGRRPVYLLSNLLMGIACVWLGLASSASYVPFIVGRAFLGLFEAPIESIVPTTITDMFFLHDRGEKVSAYGLAVLGGNELGPVFSALIVQHLSIAWAFYIVAIFIGFNAVTMFLSMPETRYLGPRPQNTWSGDDAAPDKGDQSFTQTVEDAKEEPPASTTEEKTAATSLETPGETPKQTYLSSLSPWQSPDPSVSLRKVFLRPFILVSYPTVLWSCLIYGLSLGWNVITGATVAQLFAGEPYGFDSQAQGLVFLSPFVGSLVGSWLCGSVSDSVANHFTLRNGGVREPEMRLPTLLVGTVLTFLGALVAALTYQNHTHWAGPVVGLGILTAGAQVGVSLSMSYALDCHKELSVELMVAVASIKSLIAWIWTWVINDWIIADGMLTVFLVIAGINVAIHLTTIGLFLKGKAIRVWIHERDMLGRCGLD